MSRDLSERLGSEPTQRDRIKDKVDVRIFGPYAGDCEHILRTVAKKLRHESNIQAQICMDLPVSAALNQQFGEIPDDVYNLQASIECINTADYAVFLFLDARQRRFEPYGPFQQCNIDMYDRPHYEPQDLNASNVLEFDKWIGRGTPSPERCIVIYENDVEVALGSLVKGIVKRGSIRTKSIKTNTRVESIVKLTDMVRGSFESWLTDNEDRLLSQYVDI